MAPETTHEFDLGPLSWVQGEIDQALSRGLESLALFRANPSDGTSLKHARAHVHQAAGAIQMVGLDAVVAFTDELERQLAGSKRRGRRRGASSIAHAASSRSSWTSSSTARRRFRSSCIRNTSRCKWRAA
jgi:chemosensory pili system protein ChpA (sensor histidine kinase/response regulator)